jgi:hypothetical protein
LSQKWEYQIVDLTITNKWNSNKQAEEYEALLDTLNNAGNNGWELVSYEAIPLVGRWSKEIKGYAYMGILKKPM